jgi:DNA-binding CsgD family transcriptional regulator
MSNLPDLVAKAYEGACNADGMDIFIQSAGEYFGAQSSALVIWPLKNPEAVLPLTHGISRDDIRAHFENRVYPDTLFGKLATLPTGETFIAEGLSAGYGAGPDKPSDLEPLEILAGVVVADDKNRCGIFFARNAEQSEFSSTEHEALRSLMVYFRRAIDLNKRFIDIFNQQKAAVAVLNKAPRAIIAIGQNCQVIHINDEGKRILRAADGISLVADHLMFNDEEIRQQIREFLDYAREIGTLEGKNKRISTSIKRRSMAAPYQLMAYTLPFEKTKAAFNEGEAMAAVIIYDPAAGIDLRFDGLKTFYELSSAEARLAEIMLTGQGLPEASETLGISVNTARSQLRGIFKKVGVTSQAALLKEFAKALKFPELPD